MRTIRVTIPHGCVNWRSILDPNMCRALKIHVEAESPTEATPGEYERRGRKINANFLPSTGDTSLSSDVYPPLVLRERKTETHTPVSKGSVSKGRTAGHGARNGGKLRVEGETREKSNAVGRERARAREEMNCRDERYDLREAEGNARSKGREERQSEKRDRFKRHGERKREKGRRLLLRE